MGRFKPSIALRNGWLGSEICGVVVSSFKDRKFLETLGKIVQGSGVGETGFAEREVE